MTLAGGLAQAGQAAETVALVAQPPPTPEDPGGRGEDFGKSSPVGLLVVLLLLVAVAFLIRSMTKHLRRVPASFDEPETAPPTTPTSNGEPEEKK
jgi:hypothetical protein